jgi:hypothetical protein
MSTFIKEARLQAVGDPFAGVAAVRHSNLQIRLWGEGGSGFSKLRSAD